MSREYSKISSKATHLGLGHDLTIILHSQVIQGRIQISSDLKQRKLGDEAAKGQELVRAVHKVRLFRDYIPNTGS